MRRQLLVSPDAEKDLKTLIAEILDVLAKRDLRPGASAEVPPKGDVSASDDRRARLEEMVSGCLEADGFRVLREPAAASCSPGVPKGNDGDELPPPEYIHAVATCLNLHAEDERALYVQWCIDSLRARMGKEFARPMVETLLKHFRDQR